MGEIQKSDIVDTECLVVNGEKIYMVPETSASLPQKQTVSEKLANVPALRDLPSWHDGC